MIKLAIVGVGNCASSLVQGVHYCREFGTEAAGLFLADLGGYTPEDVEVVAAFDVDRRKVGRALNEAIFQPPNNTTCFHPDVPDCGVVVSPGKILDGVSALMSNAEAARGFDPIDDDAVTAEDIVSVLKGSGAQVLISFLPVGSQLASEFYAQCALDSGVAMVNAIPVFLASDERWAKRFADAGLPLIGDDIKAQIGATIIHRALVRLFSIRGAEIDRSYQLNVGGNTDFLNMQDTNRITSKRHSKTEAVQSAGRRRLADNDVRIGPSDYVPWLNDRKVGYVRVEGRIFGGVPVDIDLRLSVEDSPNAAAMALAAIRCARIALDRGIGGAIPDVCAFLFKHPPHQIDDEIALQKLLEFAREEAG